MIHHHFTYDADDGELYWKVPTSNRVSVGDPVGNVLADGYINVKLGNTYYKLHRLIWLYVHNEWPDAEIDHEDRDRSNNRISNLRPTSSTAQNYNRDGWSAKGLPKGVSHQPHCKVHPYMVYVRRHGKPFHRSYHTSLTQATECVNKVYQELERIEHGS